MLTNILKPFAKHSHNFKSNNKDAFDGSLSSSTFNSHNSNQSFNQGFNQSLHQTSILRLSAAILAIVSSTVLMTACATKPVYHQSSGPNIQTNANGVPNYYKVRSGDTVSQIAKRYGLNYRQVGAINNLDSRYTIYDGQWLKLWKGGVQYRQQQSAPVTYTPPRSSSQVGYTPSQTSTTPKSPNNGSGDDYMATVNSTTGYSYPTNSPVIKNFDANSNTMGMWFSGRRGDPVLASKGGQVLYAGDGLTEYGNLIMIRHDDTYITAYAHNDTLLVKEGDQVNAGQRIATMGSSGDTNQVALQFQVRENGTPIDPRAVLGLN